MFEAAFLFFIKLDELQHKLDKEIYMERATLTKNLIM